MSIPNTFNPSDYEYLIRSLSEGSHPARAETLRRFITLAGSDKKQFSLYSKRIVLALQELICEPKVQFSTIKVRNKPDHVYAHPVDHKPQSERYRVLPPDQVAEENSTKPRGYQTAAQENLTLLYPRLHQNIPHHRRNTCCLYRNRADYVREPAAPKSHQLLPIHRHHRTHHPQLEFEWVQKNVRTVAAKTQRREPLRAKSFLAVPADTFQNGRSPAFFKKTDPCLRWSLSDFLWNAAIDG